MMLRNISLWVLLSLALVGASQAREVSSDEHYWYAVWPNTPIPGALKDLLNAGAEDAEIDNLPMKIDNTQYPKNFFFQHELYPGKTVNVEFSKRPFTQPYGVWSWVPTVKDVEKEGFTYEEICGRNPAKGEQRHCAKSLGSLIGFAISKLGKNIKALSSSWVDNHQTQYTIEGVQNLGDEAVICHRLNFRQASFYCHEVHDTASYMVSLVASDGTRVHALANCHRYTSSMNAEVLYELLKTKPGTATACHFHGNKAVLLFPTLAIDAAYNVSMAG